MSLEGVLEVVQVEVGSKGLGGAGRHFNISNDATCDQEGALGGRNDHVIAATHVKAIQRELKWK